EAGARAGMIAPDELTFEYIASRTTGSDSGDFEASIPRLRDLRTDDDAEFDQRVSLDASRLEPMITYGTNPSMATAITGRVPNPALLTDSAERARLTKALEYMKLAPGQPLAGT